MDTDADVMVALLHRRGSCPLAELPEQPELAGWARVRIEAAVSGAWAAGWVYVDADDEVVPLWSALSPGRTARGPHVGGPAPG